LIAAVHWAAFGPEPSGVTDSTVVVMHGSGDDGTISVNPGCAVRKNHSSRRDAFTSINQNPLGSISINGRELTMNLTDSYSNLLNGDSRTINLEPTNFDCDIKIMQLIAGPHLQGDQIIHAMKNGYQGVLFWGTGLGHLPLDNPGDAPENDGVQDAISQYIGGGGVAVVTTQCISGPVHLDVYSKGRDQQELGILGHGTNFTPEVSLVKLHHLLSLGLKGNEIASAWAENLVGENPSSI
jgi:glutamyl-tRNA(Gln) amidotransferase subunit D